MEQPGPTNSSYKDPDETIRDLIGLIGAYSGEQGAQRGFLAAHANHLSHQELVERARRVPVPDQGDGHRHQAFNYLVAAAQRYGLPLQEGGLTAYSRGEVPSQPEERSLPVAPHHIHLPNQEMMERAHSVGVERRLSAGSHQPEPLHYHSNAPSHAQHAYQRPASAGPLVHRPPMHQEIMTNNAPPHSADSIVREAYVRSMAGEEGDQPDYLHHSGGQSTTRQTDSTSVIQKAYEQVMGAQESPASPSPPAPSLQAQSNTATITVSQLQILSRQQQLQQQQHQHHPPPPQSDRHGNDHIKIPTSSENTEPQQPDVKFQQDKQEIELRPTTESTGSLEQRAPEQVTEQQVQQFPQREGDEKGEGHQNGDPIESTGKTVESGLVNLEGKQSTKCASCLAAFTPADGEVQPGVLPLCHTCLERFTSTLPRCKECGKKLTTDESLITHQCDGQGESFMCEVCGKVFSLAKHLSRHKVVHNPFKAHECAHCGKRFGRMEHLKRHRLTHAANKPYMCDKCGKTFSRSDNLNTHKCNLGEPRPRQKRKPLTFEDTGEVHPCDMCDKKFPTHQKLKRHKRQHSQSKPHQCNQCEKSFSCISHLKRHKMGHLGVKPFSCTLCGKSFGTTSHLNRHMMTHTGSSSLFKCKKCTAFFSTSEQLKEHYQIHMQQPHPPISTNSHFPLLLNKDPSNEDTRQSHFPVHYEDDDREHNTDMYCCHICKRYFNNPISLNQHNCFPADESHNHGSSMQESFTSPPAASDSNQYNSEMTSPPLSAPISAPISAPPLPTQPEVTSPVSTLPQPLEALGLSARVVQPLPSQGYKDLEQTTHHLLAVAEKVSQPEAYTTKEKGSESEQDLPRSLNEIDANKEIANEKNQLIPTVFKEQPLTDEEVQKRLFTCKVCGIFCGSLTGLQLHVQVHTLERPFKCETCGKRFRRQSHMERHRLIHSGVKPYSCDICEKTFTRPDNLNFHRSTHFKNEECEPIPCGTCGRKYPNVEMFGKHKCMDPATAAQLPVHLRPKVKRYYIGENEEKPCDVCSKVFRSGSRLTRHMLIHSRPNSFKCDVCSKVFNRRDHLKRHQLTHSGIRPYGCTQCGKRFVRNDHLQHHARCHLISEAGNKGRGGGGGRSRGKGRGRPRGVGKGRGKLAPVKPDNAFFCHVCGMRFSNMAELEQHECTNNSPCQAVMTVPKPLQRINRRKRKTKLHVTKRKINEGPTVKEEDEQDSGINDEAGPSRRKSARPRKSTARRFSAVLTSDVSDDEGAKGTVAWDHDSPYPSRKIGNLEPREKQLRSCRENKLHTCDICGNVFHHFQIFQQHQMICAYKTSSMYYDDPEPEPEPDQDQDQGPEPEDLDSEVEEGEIRDPVPAPPVANAVVLAGQVSNSAEEEVTCGVCGKSFNKMEKLMRHVKIHTTDKKYECEFCKKSFGRSDHLARHRRTHTEKKFHCKRCDDRFKDVKEYRLHMETHKEVPVEKAYSCTLCDMSFPKHTTLIKHKLSHNVEGQHQCKKCGDVHPDETSLESHECQQDEDKVHTCLDCGKGFKTVYALTRHLFCHTGLRPYECEKCGKKFTRSGHLRRHQISHSDEKPYDCDLCDKKFRRIDHMRIHKKTHEKKAREKREPSERPYGCDICNKKFRTEPALERHKTRHTVERRYMCDICGKTFKRMDNLRMHNRVHTGEKPHTCQECGKQFSHHTALRGHMRTHSDEQPYVCEICGRAFKHPHNMRSHQYVHGLQKPFNCEHCQKPFRDTYHLRLHISRCHDPDRVRKPRGGGRKSSSATGGATAAAASAAAAAAAAAANANNLIINPNQQAEQKPVINSPVSEAEPSATPHQSTESPSPVPSSHLKKNPLACERCHLAFPNLEHLHTHQCPALYHMSAHVSHTSHSSHSSFNCNRCNRTFQDSHQLRMHLLTHKEDPSVICAISAIQENFEEPQAIQQRYQMAVHPDHPGPLAYTVPHQSPYMISQSNQLAYSVAHSLPNPRVHGAHGEVPSYQML